METDCDFLEDELDMVVNPTVNSPQIDESSVKSTLAFLDEFSNLPTSTTSLDTSAPHQDSEEVVKFPFDDISKSVGVSPVQDISSVIPDETGSLVAALPEPTKLTQSDDDPLLSPNKTGLNEHRKPVGTCSAPILDDNCLSPMESTSCLLDEELNQSSDVLDDGIPNPTEIMVFHPTWEEFKDFNKYISYIESQKAHTVGLAKIIPPKEWVPRRSGYENVDVMVCKPITQQAVPRNGGFEFFRTVESSKSLKEFETMANSPRYCPPKVTTFEDIEHRYWLALGRDPAQYGADVCGSITDDDQEHWNIQRLGTCLDILSDEDGMEFEGVNTPYMYFGMWKASFAWHTEDMDLYSINYVHFGAHKSWYCVPPEHGKKLEKLAAELFPNQSSRCQAFLRHKSIMIPPSILRSRGIPVKQITQKAGEIMITFPYGYHSGFNHGFNCAESTNFATPRWVEYGKRCTLCNCGHSRSMVRIHMDCFVKKLQPQLYDSWKAGTDVAPHPHDRDGDLRGRPTAGQAEFVAATEEQIEETIGPDVENDKDKGDELDLDFLVDEDEPQSDDDDDDYFPDFSGRRKKPKQKPKYDWVKNVKPNPGVVRQAQYTTVSRVETLYPQVPCNNYAPIPVVHRPKTVQTVVSKPDVQLPCGKCDSCLRSPCGSCKYCWGYKGVKEVCMYKRCAQQATKSSQPKRTGRVIKSTVLKVNVKVQESASFVCKLCGDSTFENAADFKKHVIETHNAGYLSYYQAVRIGDYNPFFPCMHSNLQSGIPTLPCSVKVQKLKLAKEVESTTGDGTSPGSTTAVDDETFMLLACEFCDQRYCSRASLRAHMLKHEYVQRRLSSVLAMQQVSKCLPGRSQPVAPPPLASSKGGGFMCLVCLMKYARETDLSRHLLEDHKNDRGTYVDNGTPPVLQCLLCGLLFKLLMHLKTHIFNEHRMSPSLLLRNLSIWKVDGDKVSAEKMKKITKEAQAIVSSEQAKNLQNGLKVEDIILDKKLIPVNDITKFQCYYCNQHFGSNALKVLHMDRYHRNSSSIAYVNVQKKIKGNLESVVLSTADSEFEAPTVVVLPTPEEKSFSNLTTEFNVVETGNGDVTVKPILNKPGNAVEIVEIVTQQNAAKSTKRGQTDSTRNYPQKKLKKDIIINNPSNEVNGFPTMKVVQSQPRKPRRRSSTAMCAVTGPVSFESSQTPSQPPPQRLSQPSPQRPSQPHPQRLAQPHPQRLSQPHPQRLSQPPPQRPLQRPAIMNKLVQSQSQKIIPRRERPKREFIEQQQRNSNGDMAAKRQREVLNYFAAMHENANEKDRVNLARIMEGLQNGKSSPTKTRRQSLQSPSAAQKTGKPQVKNNPSKQMQERKRGNMVEKQQAPTSVTPTLEKDEQLPVRSSSNIETKKTCEQPSDLQSLVANTEMTDEQLPNSQPVLDNNEVTPAPQPAGTTSETVGGQSNGSQLTTADSAQIDQHFTGFQPPITSSEVINHQFTGSQPPIASSETTSQQFPVLQASGSQAADTTREIINHQFPDSQPAMSNNDIINQQFTGSQPTTVANGIINELFASQAPVSQSAGMTSEIIGDQFHGSQLTMDTSMITNQQFTGSQTTMADRGIINQQFPMSQPPAMNSGISSQLPVSQSTGITSGEFGNQFAGSQPIMANSVIINQQFLASQATVSQPAGIPSVVGGDQFPGSQPIIANSGIMNQQFSGSQPTMANSQITNQQFTGSQPIMANSRIMNQQFTGSQPAMSNSGIINQQYTESQPAMANSQIRNQQFIVSQPTIANSGIMNQQFAGSQPIMANSQVRNQQFTGSQPTMANSQIRNQQFTGTQATMSNSGIMNQQFTGSQPATSNSGIVNQQYTGSQPTISNSGISNQQFTGSQPTLANSAISQQFPVSQALGASSGIAGGQVPVSQHALMNEEQFPQSAMVNSDISKQIPVSPAIMNNDMTHEQFSSAQSILPNNGICEQLLIPPSTINNNVVMDGQLLDSHTAMANNGQIEDQQPVYQSAMATSGVVGEQLPDPLPDPQTVSSTIQGQVKSADIVNTALSNNSNDSHAEQLLVCNNGMPSNIPACDYQDNRNSTPLVKENHVTPSNTNNTCPSTMHTAAVTNNQHLLNDNQNVRTCGNIFDKLSTVQQNCEMPTTMPVLESCNSYTSSMSDIEDDSFTSVQTEVFPTLGMSPGYTEDFEGS